ncbi:pentapeptide repeat-containing protein [Campylobacter sp.]|uniref:pentapeptide repeat-containing protein n=1 Tax=Campylobacter sp. TaxID=205 RepID=UPI0025C3DDF4|nr:pentapeptide repeat-containing protein [Campylobacter sp.]
MKNSKERLDDLKSRGFIGKDVELANIAEHIDEENGKYIIKNFYGPRAIDRVLNLTKIICELEVEFQNCDFYSLNITGVIGEKISFIGCKFKEVISFENSKFKKYVSFEKSEFNKIANFSNCIFEKAVSFDKFGKKEYSKPINFSNVIFQDNAYFNNIVFDNCVDFHGSIFKKLASFYGTRFKNFINFSATIFEGDLNLINSKLDFEYKDLKRTITKAARNSSVKEAANDFRDSFRVLKNTATKTGNHLDAIRYCVSELYCKEIELEDDLKNKESKDPARKNIKNFIDLMLLKLYRVTSDHHSNLVKIINFAVTIVMVYGVLNLLFPCLYVCLEVCLEKEELNLLFPLFAFIFIAVMFTIRIRETDTQMWKDLIIIPIFPIFLIDMFQLISSSFLHYSFLSELNDIINTTGTFIFIFLFLICGYTYISEKMGYKISYVFHIFIYVCFIMFLLVKPELFNPFSGIFQSTKIEPDKFRNYVLENNESAPKEILNLIKINSGKSVDYDIKLIANHRLAILKQIDSENNQSKPEERLNVFSYFCPSAYLEESTNDKKYVQIYNILLDDEISEISKKISKAGYLVYAFIMLLIIYSLTKTARRNSIVPS